MSDVMSDVMSDDVMSDVMSDDVMSDVMCFITVMSDVM